MSDESTDGGRQFGLLLEALKRAAAALKQGQVPFALAGGLAGWARGGAETDHDVDLFVKPEDVERSLELLASAGFRVERPAEDWLVKVYDGEALIDLIHHPNHRPVDDAMLARASEIEVYAIVMRVISPTDLLATKLLAMREHYADYESVVLIARTLREQVDWDELEQLTAGSPWAAAFLTLVRRLGVAPPAGAP